MPIVFLNGDNVVEKLKQKEIYIVGAGEKAKNLAICLGNNNLKITAFCVDAEYYVENHNNVICINDVPKEDYVALVYGMASVSRFRQLFEEFPDITLYVWWDSLWEYNEDLMNEHREEFVQAEQVFADELSRKIVRSYLLGKKLKGNKSEFAYCTDGTYFNALTTCMSMGGIDCGAYIGDTVRRYLEFTDDSQKKVWAFEPDLDNFQKLVAYCQDFPNVECLNYGVWDKDEILHFHANGSADAAIRSDGNIKVTCKMIDNVVGEGKVGFIKMDVEGDERHALLGAKNIIRRNKPVLANSAYHLWDALAVLPILIDEITDEGYSIYLRHHGIVEEELVIYAIPPVNNK